MGGWRKVAAEPACALLGPAGFEPPPQLTPIPRILCSLRSTANSSPPSGSRKAVAIAVSDLRRSSYRPSELTSSRSRAVSPCVTTRAMKAEGVGYSAKKAEMQRCFVSQEETRDMRTQQQRSCHMSAA